MGTRPNTILITGGSRGIGATTAILAAQRGFDVCLTYRHDQEAARKVADEIESHGRTCLPVQADLASEESIVQLWRQAIATFPVIDVLVNNAAILERQQTLSEFDQSRLERVFQVNVVGTMLCTREAVRHMSTQSGGQGGVIVNLSSAAARLGSANEYIDYAASKGAIDTMTIGLAKEVALQGIRVNAVRPGGIYTDIHASGGEPNRVDRVKEFVPMKRGGMPAEIAEAILWLASPASSYTTGAILDVTGGI